MAIYVLLASEFFLNYKRGKVVRKLKPTELQPSQSDIVPGIGLPSGAEDKPEEEMTTGDHLELGQELSGKESMGSMNSKMKLMVFGLGFSTVLLFIRAVYRTAEASSMKDLPLVCNSLPAFAFLVAFEWVDGKDHSYPSVLQ